MFNQQQQNANISVDEVTVLKRRIALLEEDNKSLKSTIAENVVALALQQQQLQQQQQVPQQQQQQVSETQQTQEGAQEEPKDLRVSQTVVVVTGCTSKHYFHRMTMTALLQQKLGLVGREKEPDTPTASNYNPFSAGQSFGRGGSQQMSPINWAVSEVFGDEDVYDPEISTDFFSFHSLPKFIKPPSPRDHVGVELLSYLQSYVKNGKKHSIPIEEFAKMVISAMERVKLDVEHKPLHRHMASPVYCFGDLHGNLDDLDYFVSSILTFNDVRYTPCKFLFLGDYVDRGEFSLEVVAYLCAMYLQSPETVLMLRGNHEDTMVNSDLTYGTTGFRSQLYQRFGMDYGNKLYLAANNMFQYFPLCCSVDKQIFCVHGGLPMEKNFMEYLEDPEFPRFQTLFAREASWSDFQLRCQRIAMDMCWADPADQGMEGRLDMNGFGPNPRGQNIICFGKRAVDAFMAKHGYKYIFRAHQERSDGVKLSQHAQVFTIFSSSNYVGHNNGAGVLLVSSGIVRLVVKDADEEPMSDDDEECVEISHPPLGGQ